MAATAASVTAGLQPFSSGLFPTPIVNAKDILSSKNDNSKSGNEGSSFFSTDWFKEAQKDPILPALTPTQRLMGFTGCMIAGIVCFVMAGLLSPFLVFKARKFALLFTLGSFFTIFSFSMIWGPVNHAKHLFSSERLAFTLSYFLSLFATLYAALIMRSTLVTIAFALVQIAALSWYVGSYVPGGLIGLKFMSKMCSSCMTKSVKATISV